MKYSYLFTLILGLAMTCASASIYAEVFGNAEIRFMHDSNLNNSNLSDDIVSDSAIELGASVGQYIQLNTRDSFSIYGAIKAVDYKNYDGMNNISLGANIAFKQKWALGLYSPWTALSGSVSRLEFNNDVRDGWLYQAQIGAGKRLSERWNAWTEVLFEKRSADNSQIVDPGVSGNAFEQFSQTLKVYGVYSFNQQSFITLGYQLRRGDVVSTSREEHPGSNFNSVMTAVTFDPVFGANAEAYRLHGITQIFGIRANRALSDNLLLGVEYQRCITHADGNNNYYKNIPAITLSYGF